VAVLEFAAIGPEGYGLTFYGSPVSGPFTDLGGILKTLRAGAISNYALLGHAIGAHGLVGRIGHRPTLSSCTVFPRIATIAAVVVDRALAALAVPQLVGPSPRATAGPGAINPAWS
jgi:hypothetical protein